MTQKFEFENRQASSAYEQNLGNYQRQLEEYKRRIGEYENTMRKMEG